MLFVQRVHAAVHNVARCDGLSIWADRPICLRMQSLLFCCVLKVLVTHNALRRAGSSPACVTAATGKETISAEQQEAALEGLLDLTRCPGFMHAAFLSCDCRLERRWGSQAVLHLRSGLALVTLFTLVVGSCSGMHNYFDVRLEASPSTKWQ